MSRCGTRLNKISSVPSLLLLVTSLLQFISILFLIFPPFPRPFLHPSQLFFLCTSLVIQKTCESLASPFQGDTNVLLMSLLWKLEKHFLCSGIRRLRMAGNWSWEEVIPNTTLATSATCLSLERDTGSSRWTREPSLFLSVYQWRVSG